MGRVDLSHILVPRRRARRLRKYNVRSGRPCLARWRTWRPVVHLWPVLLNALERSGPARQAFWHRGDSDRRSLDEWILGNNAPLCIRIEGLDRESKLGSFRRALQRTGWAPGPL